MADREIRKEIIVDAPRHAVWEAWTTEQGVKTFFAPDARVELREGGAYEMYFMPDAPPGSRGGDGCQVLGFEAPERLRITWNFPPSIPAIRNEYIVVEVRFEEVDAAHTRVRLVHSGWRDGEDWDRGFEYFQRAWDIVLDRLEERFRSGPVDLTSPPSAKP